MQHQEIDLLNEKLKPFHIFKGIESDILADGSLDYSDDILALFDFVIVSIHSKFEISESEMTQRMIKAIANPYTTILAHPSGRLLLKRREYLLNYQEVLKAAAQNKVIVEINANPRRLDLDWQYYQTAKELGVYFSINPDAHSLADVSNIQFGINMARKGRLKIEDVLTTLNLAEITKYFENAKRRQK